MTVFAELLVNILYGAEYSFSVPILRIVVWFVTFSYLGSVRNIWILSKEKQKYLWMINASGAVLNVLLNAILIPIIGEIGAAIASVVTQLFANFIIGFIMVPIRENNFLIIKSLNPCVLIDMIKKKE